MLLMEIAHLVRAEKAEKQREEKCRNEPKQSTLTQMLFLSLSHAIHHKLLHQCITKYDNRLKQSQRIHTHTMCIRQMRRE